VARAVKRYRGRNQRRRSSTAHHPFSGTHRSP
jgi:hypothetical protein